MSSQVDDLRLPASIVNRLVKEALPENAIVSKEAKTAIARAASVFILNMTSVANDYAISKKRKMVTPEDVYQATRVLECEQIEKPLRSAVEMWQVVKAQKLEEAKKRRADKAADKTKVGDADADESIDVLDTTMEKSANDTMEEETPIEVDDSAAPSLEPEPATANEETEKPPVPVRDIEDSY